jgi:NTE family protein
VDFDRINAGETRLSVGAVNVRTGNFVYFDSEKFRLGPEHIMAPGALPPALPPVKIEGELYWDGGIVSNTPLQHLLDQEPQENSLVFQVDLFSARGPAPRRMADVLSRRKDIFYSSRTRQNTDTWARVHSLKMKLLEALGRIPEANLSEGEKASIEELSRSGEVNIVQLIYQKKEYEGHVQDYEFSGTSMREHWASGYADTLRHPEWLARSSIRHGIAIHDLIDFAIDQLTSSHEASAIPHPANLSPISVSHRRGPVQEVSSQVDGCCTAPRVSRLTTVRQ